MEYEEKLGEPEADSPEKGQAETPAPEETAEPAPEAEEQEPETPQSKYAGKSAEELARMLEEQERYLGRLGNELGDTRQTAEYWRQQAALAQQSHVREAPGATKAPESGWDWDRFQQAPDVTIEHLVEKKLAQVEMAREEREFAREYQRGKSLAMKERPGLFKGIEDKVEQLVANGRRGGFVNSASVGDPETWYYAAGLLKMRESDFNIGGIKPVSPTQTERPVARKQAVEETKESIEFDEETLKQIKGLGFTEAKAAALLRGEPRKSK